MKRVIKKTYEIQYTKTTDVDSDVWRRDKVEAISEEEARKLAREKHEDIKDVKVIELPGDDGIKSAYIR